MLSHKMQDNFLYADDSTTGTATDTQPTKEGQAEAAKLFTQDDLDKHIGSARKAGKETAIKTLLEELGIESPDNLKTLVKSIKEKEESEKSEAQKLSDKLAELQKQLDAEKLGRLEAEKLRLLEKRDSLLISLVQNAHNSQVVLIDLKTRFADKVNALLLENGEVDSVQAEKLIAEYKAQNGYQFKGDSKGSPSNADGRLLKPEGKVKEEVRKEIKKKFNF